MDSRMNSVIGSGFSAKPARLWQLAILTAAGVIGATSQADAAFYYWTDYSDGSYYPRQSRPPELPRQKPQKRGATDKKQIGEKEAGTKPQGPLVIVVSIDRQKVTVYDTNGVFAESPVSTGMKGHSTPMGVFSVIQKHKFHRSNLYSGAPMPYMQRITWSGVAMHAGVLPGYPASHGCIRMPMSFAMKMWNWTRMGARVIVAPGEMTPQNFSHSLLASVRVPPQPTVSIEPQTNVSDKADKGAAPTKAAEAKPTETKPTETKTASVDAALQLRASVGHTVMSDATTGNASVHGDAAAAADEVRTAEASDAARPRSDEAAKPANEDKPADQAEPAKSEAAKPNAAKAPDAPAPSAAVSPDARKDESRVAEPAPAAKPETPKRAGQIAVFISRKDSKLYVRQNFAPLFDVPVTIATSDRPLGTHVFTAELDKTDSNTLRWSVVSLPMSARAAAREDDSRLARRKVGAAVIPVAAKPVAKPVVTPDSPAQALDRISIPADTMAKINEMLTSGGSIIISDQGINQGETGEGTDFIVRLY
ncbi:L,D-transpeptidase [Bradyrhizobium sp. WBOS7]|uniref:L,D-transpeptidase n=2 Tax=Nitrobacteraceae TaxID=41294 RepID=A0AAE9NAT9_9BRAD|nr:L,D-transpeptidase [Bradyrhizobium sp. WBOS2]MDD1570086.1 L,D-transpeptidase [Bradyrhizobium sp. WBOS1]MDD1576706.1 L,D-transpeptidase [Bradyrhizobium sp. WBOS7]MDD1599018.1 L,D-transpeptidase [Bradyrhizobium sp. WBOS16]UUO36763.1 L,D-transpeptidase [Bradyrhizobium sp. WBOS01]UUO43066.1 L,D-transpeptidase [Bradyrhizobium sp. WBOS02]UUO53982.1 L,D-transpeptidase [Bradyrhizobium sp. WBOS07]UUO67987.1 L,D-transpeptidase [Bradyrhizobium betae]